MPDIRTLGVQIRETTEPLETVVEGQYVADEAISALRVVRVSAPGHCVYARHPEVESKAPLGVTTTAAVMGDKVNVVLSGEVTDPSWTWTPGQPVLLGTLGTLTQVTTSDFVLSVGIALTATTIHVRITPPIIVAA